MWKNIIFFIALLIEGYSLLLKGERNNIPRDFKQPNFVNYYESY